MDWLENDEEIEKRTIYPKDNSQNAFLSDTTSSSRKDLEDKLNHEKMKVNRLENEIQKIKSLKENKSYNKNSITQYIHEINFNELKLGKKIGQGGFSEIFETKWYNQKVAIKVIFDPNINENLLDEFNNEIEKLFILRHPNIIALYGICPKSQKLAIVTELANKGSLFDYIHKNQNNNIPITFKNKITTQLINTMSYIHECNFVHRDLKTQNILLDDNLNIKLCDFGLTKLKSELNAGSGQYAGTPAYMAPELYERKFYDEKIDVFAFGTVIWELYSQKIPYYNCEGNEIKNKVLNGEKLLCARNVPKGIVELIDKCRLVDKNKRPSFKEMEKMNLFN